MGIRFPHYRVFESLPPVVLILEDVFYSKARNNLTSGTSSCEWWPYFVCQDDMNNDVTPHTVLFDDVTSRPSRNISIRSMKFKAQSPTLMNFIRSHVILSRFASPIRDHPETTCRVVQTTGDSDSR